MEQIFYLLPLKNSVQRVNFILQHLQRFLEIQQNLLKMKTLNSIQGLLMEFLN